MCKNERFKGSEFVVVKNSVVLQLMSVIFLIALCQVDQVSHRDSLHAFATRSENLEKQCLAKAIKYYCEQRILRYSKNKTIVF